MPSHRTEASPMSNHSNHVGDSLALSLACVYPGNTLWTTVYGESLAEVNWGWRIPSTLRLHTETQMNFTSAVRADMPPVRHSPHWALLGCRVRTRSVWWDQT